ncbi:MAG: hypothetical protein Q4P24_04145 [Rhodobacterales bacterium]|nr:hypothetical protein [Rhodobacterales bacterium]
MAEHKAGSKHVRSGTDKTGCIRTRGGGDSHLVLPHRMLAALQVNLRGDQPPDAESGRDAYLKMPLNWF